MAPPKGTGNAGAGAASLKIDPQTQAIIDALAAQVQQTAAGNIQPTDATATNDPPVFLGPGAPQKGKLIKTRGGMAAGPGYVAATPDQTSSASAVYRQFNNFTQDEKAAIQQQMFVAGYYGKNANAHDILFGQADPGTLSAWADVINQASYAYNGGKGQKITPQQLVAQQALGFGGAGVTTDKYGNRTSAAEVAAKGGAGPKVSVTSASELAKMAQQLGVSILGRAANQDEQRLIIAAVQRQEAAYTGSGGGGERPAPQAIAEDVLRSKAPVEAQAHDFASSYATLLKIVGGSAGSA